MASDHRQAEIDADVREMLLEMVCRNSDSSAAFEVSQGKPAFSCRACGESGSQLWKCDRG